MITSPKAITPRSVNGCRTCRKRKVKCDEVRDNAGRCGPCSRLDRTCDWTKHWKFVDISPDLLKQYIVLERELNQPPTTFEPGYDNMVNADGSPCMQSCKLCDYATISNDGQTLFFINSNLKDFVARQNYQKNQPLGTQNTQDQKRSSNLPSEEFDPGAVKSTPLHGVPIGLMDNGIRLHNNAILPLLFDSVICPKIMPTAVRFKLNIENDRNMLLSCSEWFIPLRHAIFAITLLHYGMDDRPDLIAGSFQHYDWAINACRQTPTSANSEAIFFVHFILLVYDIACASQNWPEDRSSWALHLQKLACLAHENTGPTVSRLKAHLSWHVLLLDAQAGLVGNLEAGQYTRTFIKNGRSLPLWPVLPGHQVSLSPESMDAFLQAYRLNLMTFTMFAEQSQATLNIRRAFREKHIGLQERQQYIRGLSIRLDKIWQPDRLDSLESQEDESVPSWDRSMIKSAYTFAQLQYSILRLHLHTSMYPNQRADGDFFATENAEHCTQILNIVSRSVNHDDRENHHLTYALFLAGAVTKSAAQRKAALLMLQDMQHAGLAGAALRARDVLKFVVSEQVKRETEGGSADEVDWIELSQKHGMKNVVFGM